MSVTTANTPPSDERLEQENRLRKLFRRPELGAVGGTILVWLIFAVIAGNRGFLSFSGAATYLSVAAELGILAIAVTLLMIGGEFDLSIGSLIGASGMISAILSMNYGWNLWAALAASLVVTVALGWLNGVMVVQTKLPSFIITLGTLFMVRGATVGLTRLITGRTQVGSLNNAAGFDSVAVFFGSKFSFPDPLNARQLPADFYVSIVWWLVLAAIGTYFLIRTRPGNWIFGMGGDQNAARNVGVPVNRMKIILFMLTAAAAWLVASIQVVTARGADTLRGTSMEFYAIIAAVIGGTLLTGGYGSVIGAVFGALMYGMITQGVVYAGIDNDWVRFVLGAMLIIAVLVNNYIRKQASERK
jgi:simple sugar transport system permease protein